MLKQTTGLGVAVVILVATSPLASADGWGSVDCDHTPTSQCELEAGQQATVRPQRPGSSAGSHPSGGAPGPAGGEHLDNCGYRPSDFRPSTGPVGGVLLSSWFEGVCSATGVIQTPVELPAALSPEVVAGLARDQLGLPEPLIAMSPEADQLVNLPTWLRVASGWETRSATASVPGVSVTATARPVSVAWLMGDGHTVTCTGPGTRYHSGLDARSSSPDCGHTYRRSSAAEPHHTFVVTTTVRWKVTWSGAGESGSFADLATTATTRVRVAESQALNVPPR